MARVVAPLIVVQVEVDGKRREEYLEAGRELPAGAVAAEVERLAAMGLVEAPAAKPSPAEKSKPAGK